MAEVIQNEFVRVWSLAEPDGVDESGRPRPIPARRDGLAVCWTAPVDEGRLFQVYVNGELVAVSADPGERRLDVPVGPTEEVLSVSVVGVSPAEAGTDFSPTLPGLGGQSRGRRALLRWVRTNRAELGATLDIFGNGGSGEIDLDRPMNARPIAWYPDGLGKWGWGLGQFGQDDFGFNGSRSVGFGRGAFGVGEFGFDGEWAGWLSEPLAAGEHRFAAVARDRLGNAAGPSDEVRLTIVEPPGQIRDLAVVEDEQTGEVSLTWRRG